MVRFWGEDEAAQEEARRRQSRAREQAARIARANAQRETLFPAMKNVRAPGGVRLTFAPTEGEAYRSVIEKLDDAGASYGRMMDNTGMHIDIETDEFARAFL